MSKYFIAAYTACMVLTAILALIFSSGPGMIFMLPFIFNSIAFAFLCLVFIILKSLKADPILSYFMGLLITVGLFIGLMSYFTDESVCDFIMEAGKSWSFWVLIAPYIYFLMLQ